MSAKYQKMLLYHTKCHYDPEYEFYCEFTYEYCTLTLLLHENGQNGRNIFGIRPPAYFMMTGCKNLKCPPLGYFDDQ